MVNPSILHSHLNTLKPKYFVSAKKNGSLASLQSLALTFHHTFDDISLLIQISYP